jgi:hypothetical protein
MADENSYTLVYCSKIYKIRNRLTFFITVNCFKFIINMRETCRSRIQFQTGNMPLDSNQLLTEMSNRNLPGGKVWPKLKAYNLTATICEQIV